MANFGISWKISPKFNNADSGLENYQYSF